MDELEQKELLKKFKMKMWIGLSSIVIVGLLISIYFIFINPIERNDEVVNTNAITNSICTQEFCSQYNYGTCPDNCQVKCTSSHCEGDTCTDDCGGPGSCYCDTNTVINTNSTDVDTSDWLTYENEEYSFSFQYYNSWEIVNNKNEWGRIVGLRNKSTDVTADENWSLISISSADNPGGLSVCDYYKLRSEESSIDFTFPDYCADLDHSDIRVSGLEAIQFSVVPGVIGSILTSVKFDNKIYSISMYLDKNRNDTVYNNVIESFKFIE